MNYSPEIKNRLKRVEGQVRGVLRMMEEGQECNDVIHQLSAVRNAVDRVIVHVIGTDMSKCLMDEMQKQDEQRDTDKIIKDAIQLLLKTR
ncbi:metal-sensing transcriptional repressor [Tepidibacillus sp. HK-1]|uniref:metal-sensing transcriptional repressor n=1 Tax=Tepidibacillus sp. HK-1 TaxID=1883407 RepID=UPI00085376F7|nr:metal-sensing transcriptional repressor [Tepidibacillus sp. HK-1]GBF12440.1 copper-sensing transcriptional repressor CsoR [Tepidibacillus sp. HK-1]